MSIHQQIIDSKKEFQAYQGSSDLDKALQWVEIDYQLADGSIMVRSYDVPAAKNYYENADSVVSRIYAMSMDPENYLKGNLMVNYDDPNNHIISMEFDTYDQNLEYGSINIPDERAQEIYDAYLKDIPFSVDIVDVFRRSECLPDVAYDFLETKDKVFWSQIGLEIRGQRIFFVRLIDRIL